MATERMFHPRRRLVWLSLAAVLVALGVGLVVTWVSAQQAAAREVTAIQFACYRELYVEQVLTTIRPGPMQAAARQQMLAQIDYVLAGVYTRDNLLRNAGSVGAGLDLDPLGPPAPLLVAVRFTDTHVYGDTAFEHADVTFTDTNSGRAERWTDKYSFMPVRIDGDWRISDSYSVSQ